MDNPVALHIMLVAVLIVLATVPRFGMVCLEMPALVGYMLLGVLLRVADEPGISPSAARWATWGPTSSSGSR